MEACDGSSLLLIFGFEDEKWKESPLCLSDVSAVAASTHYEVSQ